MGLLYPKVNYIGFNFGSSGIFEISEAARKNGFKAVKFIAPDEESSEFNPNTVDHIIVQLDPHPEVIEELIRLKSEKKILVYSTGLIISERFNANFLKSFDAELILYESKN